MFKVFIISNCQSLPIASIWKSLRPSDSVARFDIHSNPRQSELAGAARRCQLADVVLYVPVDEHDPIEFARRDSILALRRSATLCVPLINFRGLHPDILCLGSARQRLLTPMGEYHSRIVLRSFLKGLSVEQTAREFAAREAYQELGYFRSFAESLQELARADEQCDISGSALISHWVRAVPILFTIDRPTNHLVKALVVASMYRLGLKYQDVPMEFLPSTLASGPVWPIPEPIVSEYRLMYGPVPLMKTSLNEQTALTIPEFVAKTFFIYRQTGDALLRFEEVRRELAELKMSGDEALKARQVAIHLQMPVSSAPLRPTRDKIDGVWLSQLIMRPYGPDKAPHSVDACEDELWLQAEVAAVVDQYVQALQDVGREGDATAVLEGQLRAQPGANWAYQSLIALSLKRGLLNEGLAVAILWVERMPSSAAAWRCLADLYSRQKRYIEALNAIESAIHLEPNNLGLQAIAAHVLDDAGDMESCLAQMAFVVARRPPKSSELTSELLFMAEVYGRMNMTAQVTATYSRALANDPSCAEASEYLANVHSTTEALA